MSPISPSFFIVLMVLQREMVSQSLEDGNAWISPLPLSKWLSRNDGIECCYGIFLLTYPDKYTMNLLAIEQREIPNNSAHKTLWKMTPFPNL